MFWIYMLRCADSSYYVGHTDNLEQRLAQHHKGSFPDCYTYTRRPLELVFTEESNSRDDAFARERQIKGWNRAKKTALIEGNWGEVSRVSRFKYGRKNPSTGSG